MFYKTKVEPFKDKLWLSSPTMHGEEIKYMQEAYETNWMSTVGKNIDMIEKLACKKVSCCVIIWNCSITYGCTTGRIKSVWCSGSWSWCSRGQESFLF